MKKEHVYSKLWKLFDIFFDIIVIIAIGVTAFAGMHEILVFFMWSDVLPVDINLSKALNISLNSIVIVKIYETLKMFVSHEDLSLIHIIEVGLIGLCVKMFFDNSYLSLQNWVIFLMFFAAYMALKRWKKHFWIDAHDH